MFGLSSMNSGAFCILVQNWFRVFQRSGVMSSARRRAAIGILVSAGDNTLSELHLAHLKLKTTEVNVVVQRGGAGEVDAERGLTMAGRPTTTTICPGAGPGSRRRCRGSRSARPC